MDRTYSTYVRIRKCVQSFTGNPEGMSPFKDAEMQMEG